MIELDIECSPASASLDLKRVDRLCHALENRQELMSQVRKHLNLRPPQHDRVKLPTLADRFNHTRNVAKSTSKFFTTGRNVPPGCERDVTKEKNPFSRCKDTDLLQKVFMHTENRNQAPDSCFIQKHCMNPCICRYPNAETKKCTSQSKKRTSWESAHSSFQVMNKGSNAATPKCPPEINPICARLYVPDVPIPPSKTDLDPEYFNVARGRPVKETFNRHDFSRIQKTVFFQKLFAGFLDDEVKKRQEHHRLDMWELTNISRELDRMKATQEEFANQSHSESVNIVTEQMAISKIREKREEELLRCKGYVNIIKSSLYKKDDMLSTSMYCRDILLQLSPTKFRNAYEEEVQAYRKETSQLANQAITIFSEYCRYNPDPEPDLFLNELVHTFVKQLLSLGPPKIYFKSKWQIDMVFREMELHCMEQMDDLQRMNRLEDEIDGIVHDVKKFYHTQSSLVTQEIDAFRSNSEYQTQRSLDLETETNFLMSTSFKDTVSGDVYLETLALVEVLYSYVLGPSNSKFDGPEMMLQIEEELRDVDIQIREMGKAQYLICEKKVEKRMAKEIKEAQLAKKQDRAVRGGIARVRKMYLRPPYGHGWRKVIPRSPPLLRNGKVPRPEEVKRKESKRLYKHLQLEGICDRDDVEAEIDELLTNFLARRRQQSSKDTAEDDSIVEERSSLRSSVSSDALNMAIQLFESQEEEEKSEKSLSLVQLGYDSEEELLRKNYEMRKRRGEDIPEPDVLYEIKSIDSKFMVSPEERKPPMKDRRHVHRPEPTLKPTNPLSWR